MLSVNIIKNLNKDNLDFIDAETLSSSACLDRLNELSSDSQFDFEPGASREFYEKLSSLFLKYQTEIQVNQQAYNKIQMILWSLSWKAFPILNQKIKVQILSDGVVFSIKNGIDVKEMLQKTLNLYEYAFVPDKEKRRNFAYCFENNEELIGNTVITLGAGEKVKSILQNWLKDYNVLQPLSKERGKFNQINYLNQSQNVRQLSSEEKEILAKILDIYDWLLFPPPVPRQVEVEDDTGTPYITKERYQMPPNLAQAQTPKPEPSKPISKSVNLQDTMRKGQAEQIQKGISFGGTSNQVSPVAEQSSLRGAAGIKNLGGAPTLPQPLKGEQVKLRVDTDKKLEDLKGRVKKKE